MGHRDLPLLGWQSLDECAPTRRDVMGAWLSRNEMALTVHPKNYLPDDSKLLSWVKSRLERLGFYLGRQEGRGGWGLVYALRSADDGKRLPYVVKITSDASEAAAAQRLRGVRSPVLPDVFGAWAIPYTTPLWLIVREDLETSVRDFFPTLAAGFRSAGGLWDEQARRAWYERLRAAGLSQQEKALLKRFFKELNLVQQETGVTFYDLTEENIRLRLGTPMQLVIADFGFSAGPSTSIPIAKNNFSYENPRYKLLFSYGSNSPAQLQERLGRRVSGTAAYAPGWKRVFRGWSRNWGGGVATLVRDRGATAYGYYAQVTEDDLRTLDRFEGVRSGNYRRAEIEIRDAEGRPETAVVYLSTSQEFNAPTQEYLEAVAETIGDFWQGSRGRVRASDIPIRNNPSRKGIRHYPWMKLSIALPFEALAKKRGAAKVARSYRGFFHAFKKAGGKPTAMGRTHKDTPGRGDSYMWWQRRNEFIGRHMAQVKKRGESLWKPNGDPTNRHLGLIMWAYTPDPDRVLSWVKKHKARQNPDDWEHQQKMELLLAEGLPTREDIEERIGPDFHGAVYVGKAGGKHEGRVGWIVRPSTRRRLAAARAEGLDYRAQGTCGFFVDDPEVCEEMPIYWWNEVIPLQQVPLLALIGLVSRARENPAPGYQSWQWRQQDWRVVVPGKRKGDITYATKCGSKQNRTPSGKMRLCLPVPVIKPLMRTQEGREILYAQAKKKERAALGQRVSWHPRIKELHRRMEARMEEDDPDLKGKRRKRRRRS